MTCNICGKQASKFCGKCNKIAYCSKECQVSGWTEHKTVCVKQKPKQIRELPPNEWLVVDNIIGSGHEDDISIWCSSEKIERDCLKLRIVVKNFGGSILKLVAKSPLLTIKGNPIRQKVFPGDSAHFIAFNGTTGFNDGKPAEQVVLKEKDWTVASLSFQWKESETSETISREDLWKKCDFLEVPFKVEGKGVRKIIMKFIQ